MRVIWLFLLLLCFESCSQKDKNPTTLKVNLYCDPPTLDPRKASDATSINVLLALYEGLFRRGADHRPEPALAKRVEVSSDGLTYTFYLRDSSWSNGEALTAFDVARSWQTVLEPHFPAPLGYKLFVIQNGYEVKQGKLPLDMLGVKALDKKTLVVTLAYPAPHFLEILTHPIFYPVYKDYKEEGPATITNGPFMLRSWEPHVQIDLVKNPHYWDANQVFLKNIEMAMIDDTMTEFHLFESGELDWAGSPLSNLPADLLTPLQQEGKLFSYPIAAIYHYKINTERFPCNNIHIRKALSYAINRAAIIEHLLHGNEEAALCLIPPLYDRPRMSQLFQDGDKTRAKELFQCGLKELGISKEEFPTLTISYNTNREHEKLAEVIQQEWRSTFDIPVELEHSDWQVYLSKLAQEDYQIARMTWVQDYSDPLSFLEPFKYKNDPIYGNNNNTGWSHPPFTKLLDEASGERNQKKREELLNRAEHLLIEEMPIIPLYLLQFKYLKKESVKNVYLSPFGTIDFKSATILK